MGSSPIDRTISKQALLERFGKRSFCML